MPFTSRDECRKCGSATVHKDYHETLACGPFPTVADSMVYLEHLHVKCGYCGYRWMTVTRDA